MSQDRELTPLERLNNVMDKYHLSYDEVIPKLEQLLDDADPRIRTKAFEMWGNIVGIFQKQKQRALTQTNNLGLVITVETLDEAAETVRKVVEESGKEIANPNYRAFEEEEKEMNSGVRQHGEDEEVDGETGDILPQGNGVG